MFVTPFSDYLCMMQKCIDQPVRKHSDVMRDGTSKIVLLLFLVLLTFHGNLFGQKNIYLRSNVGSPWNTTTNEASMDAAFGVGNWTSMRYEWIDLPSVLLRAKFIFMEGSDNNAFELADFLRNNLPSIENWVAQGGIFILKCRAE